MKNFLFVIVIIGLFSLMACGSGSTTNETTDSTTVVSDTLSVSSDLVPQDTATVKQ